MKIINHILFYFLTITVATAQQYHAKNTDKINVFKQPNDSTLAWYGSGDVNQDNQLNWDDYNEMVANAPQIDEADINGDGNPSGGLDQALLASYLNGNIEYLPGKWNKLPTREERIDWLDKMLAIDQTDTITYSSPDWISGDYGAQTSLNFNGHKFESQEEKELAATKYDTTNIGRFNLPVWHSSFGAPEIGHGQNALNVGEDSKDPKDYVYPDQQEGNGPDNDLYEIGVNWFPPANSQINTNRLTKPFENSQGIVRFYIDHLVDFRSGDDAILNLYYYNPNVIETREQAMDETYPELNLSGIENDSIYNPNYTTIDINASDQYFDRVGYSLNGSDTTWFSTPDTSIYLNSQLGNNELLVIAEDKAGNQTLEKRTYFADSNVATEYEKSTPQNYILGDNYPNPFNATTTINFTIPQVETLHATSQQLVICDINGREIATFSKDIDASGSYSIQWDASECPSGIYFYTLKAKEFTQTRKMLLLR